MNPFDFKPQPWADTAACATADPELWYPGVGDPSAQAKAVCRECPVQLKCLEFAMATESGVSLSQRWGVWGGLSPQERANLARSRRACDHCGASFDGDPKRRYCSEECSTNAHRDKQATWNKARPSRMKAAS